MRVHTVGPGECIATIGYRYGFFPRTVWDAAENEALRAERDNPYVLRVGDVVTIPDLRVHEVVCATGRRHTFRRRGVPEKLRVRFVDLVRKGRANVHYELIVGDTSRTGTTDVDGVVETWIPPDASTAMLRLETGEVYQFDLGHIEPVGDDVGVRARLHNLGHLTDRNASKMAFRAALRSFQAAHQIHPSGEADATTRSQLVRVHGS